MTLELNLFSNIKYDLDTLPLFNFLKAQFGVTKIEINAIFIAVCTPLN